MLYRLKILLFANFVFKTFLYSKEEQIGKEMKSVM